METIEELLQKLGNKFEALQSENEDLENDIENLECEIENLKTNPSKLVEYINELEKDFYFRNEKYKERLNIQKIVDDLVRLVKG